jgi:hypothetical protein
VDVTTSGGDIVSQRPSGVNFGEATEFDAANLRGGDREGVYLVTLASLRDDDDDDDDEWCAGGLELWISRHIMRMHQAPRRSIASA